MWNTITIVLVITSVIEYHTVHLHEIGCPKDSPHDIPYMKRDKQQEVSTLALPFKGKFRGLPFSNHILRAHWFELVIPCQLQDKLMYLLQTKSSFGFSIYTSCSQTV